LVEKVWFSEIARFGPDTAGRVPEPVPSFVLRHTFALQAPWPRPQGSDRVVSVNDVVAMRIGSVAHFRSVDYDAGLVDLSTVFKLPSHRPGACRFAEPTTALTGTPRWPRRLLGSGRR